MAEAQNEEQTSSAGPLKSRLYSAEMGHTPAGSPLVKIIATNPQGKFAGERQIAATIYEIAAELERASDELGSRWAIYAEPIKSTITVELAKNSQPWVAETMIEKVLAELSIPFTNPK